MEDFNALSFLGEVDDACYVMVGQYFEQEYCPTLLEIDGMYQMTDLTSIEVPLSVKDMFSTGE